MAGTTSASTARLRGRKALRPFSEIEHSERILHDGFLEAPCAKGCPEKPENQTSAMNVEFFDSAALASYQEIVGLAADQLKRTRSSPSRC